MIGARTLFVMRVLTFAPPILLLLASITKDGTMRTGPVAWLFAASFLMAVGDTIMIVLTSLLFLGTMALGGRVRYQGDAYMALASCATAAVVTMIGFPEWGLLLTACLGFMTWTEYQSKDVQID